MEVRIVELKLILIHFGKGTNKIIRKKLVWVKITCIIIVN